MMPIFAITEAEAWILGCAIIGAICALGALVVSVVALRMKQDVKIEQPLEIRFASEFIHKSDFQKHEAANAREHENLFKKIGGVERGMNERVEKKLTDLQTAAETGREKLHQRINRISVGVARLCGRQGIPMPKEDDEL